MCGFAGVINNSALINGDELSDTAQQTSFRGPDNCGTRILNEQLQATETGNTALFFNRLAILDPDPRSNQPFEDERHLLMFNGEIYNYRELKKILEAKGVQFKTTSDTEVLFYILQHQGTAALSRLNGMFALFFLDKKEKKFILARDRLGIKPLYYRQQGNCLSFGSELYSLVRLTKDYGRIAASAVQMYLWMQYVPTPWTIIEGIFKLPPGSYLEGRLEDLKNSVLQPCIYWDAYDFVQQNDKPSAKGLEEVLKNSLERQLHADVPLGMFLSSGVDSSLLAAMMNKYFTKDKSVNFFTVSFKETTPSDESDDAAAYIKGFRNPQLHTHRLEVDAAGLQDHIRDLYVYYDEPFADSASLLNRMISRKARELATVAISGDGADELFWGYPRYNRWQKFTRRNAMPVLPGMARRVARSLPPSYLKYQLMMVAEKKPVQRHFDQFLTMGMRFMKKNPIINYPMWATEGVDKIMNRPDLPSILDIKTYLADAMLYKVDRSSMANSLEVRVPYLDNEVLEYALQLPLHQKSNEQYPNKAVLKQLLVKLAPHYDAHRPKRGFNFPLKKWLTENWRDDVRDRITADSLVCMGLEPKRYLKITDEFYKGRSEYSTDVWYLYNLVLWYDGYSNVRKQFSR
jgi:asparagine synthase (glutamine-hydrolysing)